MDQPDPADRRWFTVDDAGWEKFQAMLDRPAEDKPRLAELFNRPSPFED